MILFFSTKNASKAGSKIALAARKLANCRWKIATDGRNWQTDSGKIATGGRN